MDSLGYPSCTLCHVLMKPLNGMYECPVCEGDNNRNTENGYKHLWTDEFPESKLIPESDIPFLRFMKGKSPNPLVS